MRLAGILWAALLLLGWAALEVRCANPAIVGGQNADPNRYHYAASLRTSDGGHGCGGSLIAPEWVLTATHCLKNDTTGKPYPEFMPVVRIGGYGLNGPATEYVERRTAQTIVAPGWRWGTMQPDNGDNDMALLRLDRPVTHKQDGTPIQPIKLAPFTQKPALPVPAHTELTAIGWGDTNPVRDPPNSNFPNFKSPDNLQEVKLALMSLSECKAFSEFEWNWQSNNASCAGNKPGFTQQICYGDSGGPVFVKGAAIGQDLLIGLNSFYLRNSPAGLECIGSPVGLANVASLRQWIDATISANSRFPCLNRDPNCALCKGYGAKSCAACRLGYKLGYNGRCVAKTCLDGDRQCRVCDKRRPLRCAACKRHYSVHPRSGKCFYWRKGGY